MMGNGILGNFACSELTGYPKSKVAGSSDPVIGRFGQAGNLAAVETVYRSIT